MAKHPVTFSYVVFYILFLPDTWQAAIGIVSAYIIGPIIMPGGYAVGSRILLYIMLSVIGYAASRPLGKGIAGLLKKMILADKIK